MTVGAWDVLWIAVGALVVLGCMGLAFYASRHPDRTDDRAP